ncbi:MAG: hypothetical protein K5886_07530 [Lachnospiraceae bacterium]|nr:hypothetical protein [Lachnospiraceae bacterium]
MMKGIKSMREEELNKVNGGTGNPFGVDDGAVRAIQRICKSEKCKGTMQLFDSFGHGQLKCRNCGETVSEIDN